MSNLLYNSLPILIEEIRESLNKNQIFVFDFDKTLSTEHSKGLPTIDKIYLNDKQLQIVQSVFGAIQKDTSNVIIILSRSLETNLREYFKIRLPSLNIPKECILGASSIDDISNNTDNRWAMKKAITLMILSKTFRKPILFYDDTIENITEVNNISIAYKLEIKSYLVDDPTKLKEIYDISIVNNKYLKYKNKYNQQIIKIYN
jgi:hypothetical protein